MPPSHTITGVQVDLIADFVGINVCTIILGQRLHRVAKGGDIAQVGVIGIHPDQYILW